LLILGSRGVVTDTVIQPTIDRFTQLEVAVSDDIDTTLAANGAPNTTSARDRVQRSEQPSQEGKRWAGFDSYFSASNIIAGVSLLVAALSVVISMVHSNRTETSQRRAELIEYARQVVTLSADSKYHGDEITAISSQAAALLPTVPRVPPIIYRVLAEGLITDTGNFEMAGSLLNEAQARAESSNDVAEQIYVHRLKARLAYISRDVDGMRRERAASISISDRYTGKYKLTFVHTYGGFSHIFWAEDELGIGTCDVARRELAKAEQANAARPVSDLETEINSVKRNLNACR
jgi:hypothetical protein